jgi:hypothetical protein
MHISKKFRIATAFMVGGIVVASSACSTDSLDQATGPRSMVPAAANRDSGGSSFGSAFPDMSKDGTYIVNIDPNVANTLVMGVNKLEIPAGAVCDLAITNYGPSFWNAPCAPQTRAMQLTVTISSSGDSGSSIDFNPSLRFNPASNVMLTLSAPSVSVQDAKDWVILYCPSATSWTSGNGSGGAGTGGGDKCVNEALNDKDLKTFIHYDAKQLSRRIKHFSLYRAGYTVAE